MHSSTSNPRTFLRRLWNLENTERPGFMIGYLGPVVKNGTPIKSALFSTDGPVTVRERLQDPRQFLDSQLDEIRQTSALRGDYVPSLCPAFGVVGIPSAFGCEVVWWETDLPAVRPLPLDDPADAASVPRPVPTAGVLEHVMEYTRFFVRETKAQVPIRLTDMQGPLDNAALIMGHTNLLLAMKTDPDAVHRLIRNVTDVMIDVIRTQRDLVRSLGAEFVPSMMQPWLPDGLGIAISNDECVMISADAHDTFNVPYLNALAEEFGGIFLHSCGNWQHQFSSIERIHKLRGLEFGASEATYEPVLRRFGGRTVLAARIGLHRDLKFAGMTDFCSRLRSLAASLHAIPGLFLHVDITNGIVDETWPPSDLEQIYSLLDT